MTKRREKQKKATLIEFGVGRQTLNLHTFTSLMTQPKQRGKYIFIRDVRTVTFQYIDTETAQWAKCYLNISTLHTPRIIQKHTQSKNVWTSQSFLTQTFVASLDFFSFPQKHFSESIYSADCTKVPNKF